MLFDGWSPLLRTVVIGSLTYLALIFILRVCGKRTLSKWNAFDYVVTIALGSVLATVILSKSVSLAQGLTALALLVGLQFVVTWLSVRSKSVAALVKAKPTLLLFRGEYQRAAMRRTRVTDEEVRAALRNKGFATLGAAAAVILETDGSFSVIEKFGESGSSTLVDVGNFEPEKMAG